MDGAPVSPIGVNVCAGPFRGVQIGLININRDGWLPICPLINIGFGGRADSPVEEEPAAPATSPEAAQPPTAPPQPGDERPATSGG